MLTFKNCEVIRKYDIQLYDRESATKIKDEILSQQKTNHKITNLYVESFETGMVEFNLIPEGCEYTCRPNSAGLENVYTEIITFPAPYTLSLAAQSFHFGPYRNIYHFSQKLRSCKKCGDMSAVLGGYNLDTLSSILSLLKKDENVLNKFLKDYQPDLFYLRRYLECISLVQTAEYGIDLNKPEQQKHKITDEIKIATSNTEVSKKLQLKFRGIDY